MSTFDIERVSTSVDVRLGELSLGTGPETLIFIHQLYPHILTEVIKGAGHLMAIYNPHAIADVVLQS